jgi:hypothetical protein
MVYDRIDVTEPIRQGDIFRDVPRVDLSTSQIAVADDDAIRTMSWEDAVADPTRKTGFAAVLPLKPVHAIVITQNCDAVRGEFVSLCQIDTFASITTPASSAKKWKSLIVRHTRENLRYFYLPADHAFGFPDRMAADLRVLIRVSRQDLERMRSSRLGRLNPLAYEHFRETIAQFFRRYPYDEWYSLTREEFEEYQKDSPEPVRLFPWQE